MKDITRHTVRCRPMAAGPHAAG